MLQFFQLAIENPNFAHEMFLTIKSSIQVLDCHYPCIVLEARNITDIIDLFFMIYPGHTGSGWTNKERLDLPVYHIIEPAERIFLEQLFLSIVLNNKSFFNEYHKCQFDAIMLKVMENEVAKSKIPYGDFAFYDIFSIYNVHYELGHDWNNICAKYVDNYDNYADNLLCNLWLNFDYNYNEYKQIVNSVEQLVNSPEQCERAQDDLKRLVNYIESAQNLKQLLPLELNKESVSAALKGEELYSTALDCWNNLYGYWDSPSFFPNEYNCCDERISAVSQQQELPYYEHLQLQQQELPYYEYLQQNLNQNDGAFA